jgi:predicted transcriptional regulator
VKIHNFKYNESGLNRFFGSLEARIMSILWKHQEMTIKDVQLELELEKEVNFNTVMTVMNRLVEKHILQKQTVGRSSLYRPILSMEQFLEAQSKEITHELIEEFGSQVVSHMLDALDEADPALVEKLEQKIKEFKKET